MRTACPEDETLLAMIEGRLRGDALVTLDAHLDSCVLCRDAVAMLGSGPRRRAEPLARGHELGRFLVLDPVGEGAMGVVHAAFDPELERKVALKVLHADRGDAKARARLVREAQAMARLSHPNVVTVYDVGTRGDDVYVAMELVEGTSLRGWLATARTPEAILTLFLAAGEGLAAAHDAGLVHRDFKPENVLVGRGDVPKVGDFGLAVGDAASGAEVPEGALLEASLTRTGALLGTPAYMAPEQLDGEGADARADQFAFCVALFEALTSARPFRGDTIRDLRASIEAGPNLRGVDARVAAALRRGLSARRDDRFDDMRALLAALRPKRSFSRLAAVGLVALLVAGAAIFAWRSHLEAPCAASSAALANVWNDANREGLAASSVRALDAWATRWTHARVTACEATHVTHEQSPARMDRRMACLDRQRGAFDVVLDRVRNTDVAPFAIDAIETLPHPEVCAVDARVPPPPPESERAVLSLRRRIDEARVRVATADANEALVLGDTIVREATPIAYAPLLAEAHLVRASALRSLARFDDAEEAAERGLLVAESAGDDRGAAEGWLERVRVAGERGRFTEAARHARHAEAAIARAGAPVDLYDALRMLRGVLRTNLGELVEAEVDLRAALASARSQFGADSPRLASIHTSLGNLLRVVSRYDESLVEHERALVLDRAALGDDHPRVGRDLHNVAGLLRRLARPDEAEARYQEALEIKRAALGDDHPEVALTLNSLGLMARERGDGAEARDRWERALAIFSTHEHGDAALVLFNLALLDHDEARWESSVDHVERAIAIDSARIGPRSKRVGSEHALLSSALHQLGRRAEAEEAARTALAIAEELGDEELEIRARALLAPTETPRSAIRAEVIASANASMTSPTTAPTTANAPTTAATNAATTAPTTVPTTVPTTAPTTVRTNAPTTAPTTAPTPMTTPRPTGSGSYGAGQPWE